MKTLLSRALPLLLIMSLAAGAVGAQEADPSPVPTDAPVSGPASTVNGVEIGAQDFQARVRAMRFLFAWRMRETFRQLVQQGMDQQQAFRAVQQFFSDDLNLLLIGDELGVTALSMMEEDALLEQLAADEGISVSEEDVDAQVASFVDQPRALTEAPPDPEATAEPTDEPGPSADVIEALYAEAEERAGVSREALRAYFRSPELRGAFAQAQLGAMPETWSHVTARHILVATEADAQDVLDRLAGGEDFAALAQELSLDTGSGARGGELGTTVPEAFVDAMAEAVRAAPVAEPYGPVETEFGFHVVEVTAREDRPLDDAGRRALGNARSRAFREWLDEQVAAAEIERVGTWPDLIPRTPAGQDLLRDMMTS